MSDYPMLISNKLHSFRNFYRQRYFIFRLQGGITVAKTALLPNYI